MNNMGVIFRRALRDSRRSILGWGLGLALLAFYVTVVYPQIEGLDELNQLLENPVFQAFIPDMEEIDYTTPGGFLALEFFSWAPLILAVFGVMFGLGIVAGEEDRGTLDVLLSTPVPRWRVIVEKFAALIVVVVLIFGLTFVGFLAALAVTPQLEIPLLLVAGGVVNMLPVTLLMAALALCLSTLLRSRGQAGGVTAAIIVASYFLNSLSAMAGGEMEKARYLSFYYYYDALATLTDGIVWGNFLLLTAVAAALLGLAVFFFQRRDLLV